MKSISRKISEYAYQFWMRHQMTEWPTVRQTAKSLSIKQAEIENAAGEEYCTQSYNCYPPQPFGEHEVCAMIPEVDEAWRHYYGQPH